MARLSIALDRVDGRRFWLITLTGAVSIVAVRSITQSRAIVAGFGSLRPVAIAASDLEPGHLIADSDLVWEHWPAAIASRFPVVDPERGFIVRSPLVAGEPITDSQLITTDSALGAEERLVTIPMPLAPPPVAIADVVELIALRPGILLGDQPSIDTRSLGRGRVTNIDETGITVAVPSAQVFAVVETMTIGSVELVITPFGS